MSARGLGRIGVCALMLLLSMSSAQARTAPNPDGRLVLPLDGRAPSIPATAGRASAQAVAVSPVGLPAGAVQLDSTYYDLQDMGSLGTRVLLGPDGRVHATWQDDHCNLAPGGCPPNLAAPEPYPMRGMGYAFRDASGVWTNRGKVTDPRLACSQCVPDHVGGFGTIALTAGGRALVSQHMNEDGCDLRGDFYMQDAVNGTTWSGYLTPISEYDFPQVAALPNGSFLVLGEIPQAGVYSQTQSIAVSRFAGTGTFTCPTGWQGGPWNSTFIPTGTFPDGYGAFPSLAAASDGRAGVAVTDFGQNVWLFESSNGTFSPGTVTVRRITSYADAAVVKGDSTSAEYRPYIHCNLAYQDTTPNVVWSELQARRVGGSVELFDWRSRIRHWSSKTGISTVAPVQAGEADRYDDLDNGLHGPIAGFNTISVDWPQVGFTPDGFETYVVWLRFTDAEIDPTADAGAPGIVTGVGYGDIVASVRHDGGSWAPWQNLTQTPRTDERFVSMSPRNDGGVLRLLFQASATDQAGCVVVGDRGTSPGNLVRRIAYLQVKPQASVVAVGDAPARARPALLSYPNPARGAVRFSIAPARARRGAAVLVFTASGRRVARIPAAQDYAVWNGRDLDGRRVASGLYFARLEGDRSAGTKFMLLH